MMRFLVQFIIMLAIAATACGPVVIGRKLNVDPRATLKIGHHQKEDVLRELGEPYRRFTDNQGNEVFTYVWADGQGSGQKCTIAFNQNNVIYLLEVVR